MRIVAYLRISTPGQGLDKNKLKILQEANTLSRGSKKRPL